jgi:divalent metal cation (Fe/Co/Zn/Cd) transporter
MIAGEQRGRESALLLAAILDLGTAIMLLLVGMAVSSLTCVAEGLRAGLMVLIDFVSLVVIRRIHRGSLVGYEFGTGKLEHLCSLLVAAGLAGGALWVGTAALQLAISGRSEATPLGLALAAIGGSINLCANLVAWDGVRRTAEGRPSAIMRAQMRSRWTKLLASMTVQVTMTAAAWAKDPNLAAAADAAGALVVCAVMAGAAWAMVAEALPGLLDRSARDLAEPALLKAAQSLPAGFIVQAFRSRGTPHAFSLEVTLGCAPVTDVVATQRAERTLAAELIRALPGIELSVVVLPVPLVKESLALPTDRTID